MIKIDWDQFFKQHYWFGWYQWNSCEVHKHYKSGCEECNQGEWRFVNPSDENQRNPMYQRWAIFKMPMNNVVWSKDPSD